MKSTHLLLINVALCFISEGLFAQQIKTQADFSVIAYYAGDAGKIDQYPIEKLTHIIYSFSHLKGNQLDLGKEASRATVRKMAGLKSKNPNLKVMLSLGGWGGCETCSEVFSQEEDRRSFARSVKALLKEYEADGIDLDWEYPAVEGFPGHPFKPEDKQHFTELIRVLRDTLGESYIISFAAGGFEKYMEEAIEWEKIAPLINYVNLMSYDLVNGYSPVTGHHSPLFSTNEQLLSVSYGVDQLIGRGVPRKKIIIGAAFYGREWENVPNTGNGLYQPGKFKRSISFPKIENLEKEGSYQYLWDETASAPYLYSREKRSFITYDNRKSIKLKTNYVIDKSLGGIMFWELSLDDTRGGLLDEIYKVKILKN